MATPKLLDKNQDPRLDRYELISEIASGGMATVYLARLAGVGGFQRFVAIKRLHPHLSNETEFVQMFLDEARLAASIHHPHVVPILEVGTSQAGYYVVMEYIEGDTLAGMLAREAGRGARIPAKIAMRIALDTLAGLHAAHELRDDDGNLVNLVHRDVSPQNVLVGVDGSARITDFGVARASSRLANTRSGTLKGKLAYMPPEQAKGEDFIDQRCDVFALGVVLWECLAGRRLFKGQTELETLNRLMFEPIPTVRKFAPEVPEAIEQVLVLALERDMAKRFHSAAEFADALERAAEGAFPIASVRESAAYIQELLGQQIQQQRAAVKAWLAAEPSQGAKPKNFSQIIASDGVDPAAKRATPLPPAQTAPPAQESGEVLPLVSVKASPAISRIEGASTDDAIPASSTDAGAMAMSEQRRSSVTPPAATPPERSEEPTRRSAAGWLVPVAVLALGGAAYTGWTLTTSQEASSASTASSLVPPGTTPEAMQPPTAVEAREPSAEAAPSADLPAEPSAPQPSAIASAPAASAQPAIDVAPAHRGKATGRGGKKPSAPAAQPAAAPAEPPPAAPTSAADGYKNPYR